MKTQLMMISLLIILVLVGCISEEERLAMAAAERARQEQIDKERAEKQKTEAARIAKEAKEREIRERIERERKAKAEAEMAEKKRILSIDAYFDRVMVSEAERVLKAYHPEREYEKSPFKNPFRIGSYDKAQKKIRKAKADKKSVDEIRAAEKELWDLDWLNKWTSSRLGISNKDAQEGDALLDAFGASLMPKAFAKYKEAKSSAVEIQLLFNKNFPYPWNVDLTSADGVAFKKMLPKLSKARTEYFRKRDELLHYYVLYAVGGKTKKEITTSDAEMLYVDLSAENRACIQFDLPKNDGLDSKVDEFALKSMPETYAVYRQYNDELRESIGSFNELTKRFVMMDVVRYENGWISIWERLNAIAFEINTMKDLFSQLFTDYKIMDKNLTQIAKLDHDKAVSMQVRTQLLKTMVHDYINNPGVKLWTMSRIPNRNYYACRTEVTQAEWIMTFGYNPSKNKGYSLPVDSVSFEDVENYIKKLNKCQILKDAKMTYRLPTGEEWQFACLAGSTGKWGLLRSGVKGSVKELGWTDCDKSMPVATKQPNAFGLFDIHGNVMEFTTDKCRSGMADGHTARGGCWGWASEACFAENEDAVANGSKSFWVGFRLFATKE